MRNNPVLILICCPFRGNVHPSSLKAVCATNGTCQLEYSTYRTVPDGLPSDTPSRSARPPHPPHGNFLVCLLAFNCLINTRTQISPSISHSSGPMNQPGDSSIPGTATHRLRSKYGPHRPSTATHWPTGTIIQNGPPACSLGAIGMLRDLGTCFIDKHHNILVKTRRQPVPGGLQSRKGGLVTLHKEEEPSICLHGSIASCRVHAVSWWRGMNFIDASRRECSLVSEEMTVGTSAAVAPL